MLGGDFVLRGPNLKSDVMRKIVGTRGRGLNIMKLVNKLFTQTSDTKMILIKNITH